MAFDLFVEPGAPRYVPFGDGVNDTLVVSHPLAPPVAADVLIAATLAGVGVGLDASVAGEVTVGPFAVTPNVDEYYLVVQHLDAGGS